MILSGRSRHSRLPAGLVFSRLCALILVAADFARIGVLSKLRVPAAQFGGFYGGFAFMRARFPERGGERRIRRADALLSLLLEWRFGLSLLRTKFAVLGKSATNRIDIVLVVGVGEAGDFRNVVDWLVRRFVYRFPVSVKVLIRHFDRLGAIEVFDLVMYRSPYFSGKFPKDHLLDYVVHR